MHQVYELVTRWKQSLPVALVDFKFRNSPGSLETCNQWIQHKVKEQLCKYVTADPKNGPEESPKKAPQLSGSNVGV